MGARQRSSERGRAGAKATRVVAILCGLIAAMLLPAAAHAVPSIVEGAGYNYYGELGNGFTSYVQPTLAPTAFGNDAVEVSEGYDMSLVRNADGSVMGAGYGEYGELGNGKKEEHPLPVTANLPLPAKQIAAGGYFGLALLTDGTVAAWGYGVDGELGNGKKEEDATPAVIPGLSGITQVAASCYAGFALRSDGRVYSWGYGKEGELGNGKEEEVATPALIPGLENVVKLAAGCSDAYAILADGEVLAWGEGKYGQLGNGGSTKSTTPVKVLGPGSGVAEVAAGDYFALARKSDGTLLGWGYNGYGELGDGTENEQKTPEALPLWPAGIKQIGADVEVSYALLPDGSAWGSGYNYYSELFDGTVKARLSPEKLGAVSAASWVGTGGYAYHVEFIEGAEASASASALSFAATATAKTSAPQTVVLTNKGPAPLAVGAETISGAGAGSFSVSSNGCAGQTLAAGASCTIGVVFAPKAPGASAASLSIPSSAFNGGATVSLSGTGTAPATPALGSLSLSSSVFKAASSGPSAVAAAKTGTVISYTDTVTAVTTFVVQAAVKGVTKKVGHSKKCVAAPSGHGKKAHGKPCVLYRTLGSFTHTDAAGANKLRFTGRIKGRKLKPGTYRLLATAVASGHKSKSQTRAFKIVR